MVQGPLKRDLQAIAVYDLRNRWHSRAMNFPPLPRRRFLQACVATGSVLMLPAARAASPAIVRFATPLGTLLVLDADRAAVLAAFAEAAIATGDGFPPISDTGLVRRIDEELFFTEPAIRHDFLLAIDAADLLPLVYGRFSRLHRLPLAERREFLDGLADTRFDTVRAIANGLRLVTGLVYYADRATWAAMDYEGTHARLPPRASEQRLYYRNQTGRDA